MPATTTDGDPARTQLRGEEGRGVRDPWRLGLRQEHAAEAHDQPLSTARRAACSSTVATSPPPTATTRRDIMRAFGVMYQSGALFGSMTLLENVRLRARGIYGPADGRDGPDLPDEARAGRARCVHRPPAERDLGRDAEARGDRPGDGARPRYPVPRRAFGRARSDHLRRARCADPPPQADARRDVRRRHARARRASSRSRTA